MKLFYMRFQRATVAEFLFTDEAGEVFDACMLHRMSLQTVRRRETATADLAVIRVVPSVNGNVQLQPAITREMFATLTTAKFAASCFVCHGNWRPLHMTLHPGETRACLEHKYDSVRNSDLTMHCAFYVVNVQDHYRHYTNATIRRIFLICQE